MSLISVHDVAAYILEKKGIMSTMKLQKLVYYCQAWSLVWDELPLFKEKIEAWSNSPVVKELYNKHKNEYRKRTWRWGNSLKLSDVQKETIDSVINFYGDKSSQWLSDLIHMEDPWNIARRGLTRSERGSRTIIHSSIMDYYSKFNK